MTSIIHLNFFKSLPVGVSRQLESELSSLQSLGISWQLKVFSGDFNEKSWHVRLNVQGMSGYFIARWMFFREVILECRNKKVVLLRYSIADPVQALFSFRFKNVVTIHHTLEIDEALLSGKTKGKIKALVEYILGKLVLKKVVAVIAVTEEIAKYELYRSGRSLPFFIAPNGINMENVPVALDKRQGIPTLLFVASHFAPWHGLDLLLQSVRKSSLDFRLFLVGDIPSDLLPLIRSDARIICLGYLNKEEIANLTAECDVGISSLALFRNGMKEACTLKVREYLAEGLPCYANHHDSGLPCNFPFFRQGQADINKICDYALAMRAITRIEIRETAALFIDKKLIVARIYSWIESLIESNKIEL